MAIVTTDISPAELMGRFRGRVTSAGLAHPERARLEVTDAEGGLWRLGTWDADYAPADPGVLDGKTVIGMALDSVSGSLEVGFSDGTSFTATPIPAEDEEMENWELFTPGGLVLSHGPRGRWQLGNATDPC